MTAFHTLSRAELYDALDSPAAGLSEAEAAKRLRQ